MPVNICQNKFSDRQTKTKQNDNKFVLKLEYRPQFTYYNRCKNFKYKKANGVPNPKYQRAFNQNLTPSLYFVIVVFIHFLFIY